MGATLSAAVLSVPALANANEVVAPVTLAAPLKGEHVRTVGGWLPVQSALAALPSAWQLSTAEGKPTLATTQGWLVAGHDGNFSLLVVAADLAWTDSGLAVWSPIDREAIGITNDHKGIDAVAIGVTNDHKGIGQLAIGVTNDHKGIDQIAIGITNDHKGIGKVGIGITNDHKSGELAALATMLEEGQVPFALIPIHTTEALQLDADGGLIITIR
jgi:hypothetical protein